MKTILALLFLPVLAFAATTPFTAIQTGTLTLKQSGTGAALVLTNTGSTLYSNGTSISGGSGITTGTSTAGGLTITVSGTTITLSGTATNSAYSSSVTMNAPGLTGTISGGVLTIGGTATNPSYFLSSGTLSALQLSNTVPLANLPSSLVVSASNGLVITGGTIALNTLASGTETLGGTLKVTNAVLTGTVGTNATNLQINAAGQTITMNCSFLAFTALYGNNWYIPSGSYQLLSNGDLNLANNTNIKWGVAGYGLILKSGTNGRVGTGTLVSGSLFVPNTGVTANSLVFITDTSASGAVNIGSLYVPAAGVQSGTGFSVLSSNALDVSTFNYWIIEKQ